MPDFNLPLEEAIPVLESVLQELTNNPDQQELTGIDPDKAFLLGYETAIHDLKRVTGPDTLEVGIMYLVEGKEGEWVASDIENEETPNAD